MSKTRPPPQIQNGRQGGAAFQDQRTTARAGVLSNNHSRRQTGIPAFVFSFSCRHTVQGGELWSEDCVVSEEPEQGENHPDSDPTEGGNASREPGPQPPQAKVFRVPGSSPQAVPGVRPAAPPPHILSPGWLVQLHWHCHSLLWQIIQSI